MGRTAPPGRPNTTSTPSRLSDSRTIRAPDIFMVRLPILLSSSVRFPARPRTRPRSRSGGPRVPALPALPDAGLRGRQPGGGNHERRARDIGHPRAMAKLDRRRLSPVLPADPDLEVGARPPPPLDADPHQLANALRVEDAERVSSHELPLEVEREELAHVVAAVAVGELGQVVRPEREEAGVARDLIRRQGRAGHLDHRADAVRDTDPRFLQDE